MMFASMTVAAPVLYASLAIHGTTDAINHYRNVNNEDMLKLVFNRGFSLAK